MSEPTAAILAGIIGALGAIAAGVITPLLQTRLASRATKQIERRTNTAAEQLRQLADRIEEAEEQARSVGLDIEKQQRLLSEIRAQRDRVEAIAQLTEDEAKAVTQVLYESMRRDRWRRTLELLIPFFAGVLATILAAYLIRVL